MTWMNLSAGGFPLYLESARGARVTDLDGHTYVDFALGDTAAMAGHSPGPTVAAVSRRLAELGGVSAMMPTEDAEWVGAELTRRFGPSRWSFALTATDANRWAIRLARAVTRRPKVLVNSYCYHGSVDESLIVVGPDGHATSRAGNVGPPVDVTVTSRVAEFNDVTGLERELEHGDVAAVLMEPALTNMGIVLPEPGYLDAVRSLTRAHGALLINDETHTLSVGPGGATGAWGLQPDVVTVGKAIGGGIPVAAYGLTDELADQVGSRGDLDLVDVGGIGGTLAGNALSLAACRATLAHVLTDGAWTAITTCCRSKHALLRNFPVLGHARYLLEAIGPELRQYIVAGNNEERPFSRDQRRWVYASSKLENNYFGFGTDNDLEHTAGLPDHQAPHLRPGGAAVVPGARAGRGVELPCAKVLGRRPRAARVPAGLGRQHLGDELRLAVGQRDRGAQPRGGAGRLPAEHRRGRLSPYHRKGGELVFQIGTAYFGCRDEQGRFEPGPAQGPRRRRAGAGAGDQAQPGRQARPRRRAAGAKVSPRSPRPAASRGAGLHQPVAARRVHRRRQPARLGRAAGRRDRAAGRHQVRRRRPGLLGRAGRRDGDDRRGVDFVTIDGGEGGTGAAPLIFTDSVSLPFRSASAGSTATFAERGLHERRRLHRRRQARLPDNAVVAFALGCDMVNVAREAMLAIGCIQAQKCHTDTARPASPRRTPGSPRPRPDAEVGAAANYVKTLRRDLLKVAEACGVEHPPSSVRTRSRSWRTSARAGCSMRCTAIARGGACPRGSTLTSWSA
jgi:glutamate-1-semialdehyde aminotransferase